MPDEHATARVQTCKNTYKNNENLSERTPSLGHHQHTFNMNKKHYNRRWFWSTLPNALRAIDLGGLPGELWRTCVSKLDGGAKNIFWRSNLTLFGLIFLFSHLLIQLVWRFGKYIFYSSPAPWTTWPELFGMIFIASPTPHPTCQASRQTYFS